MNRVVDLCHRLVKARAFEYGIIAVIIANSILLGMETSVTLERHYGHWMHLGNQVALGIFIVEAALKIIAVAPRIQRYFMDGWNLFDFLIIVLALVPSTGQFAMIARLARLLRVLRLITAIKELRLIIAALMRSIPSVGHVMMLMSIIVYIYAVMGYHLFSEHDPENWRTLGISLLTLFNIITLEGWTDIMRTAMELNSFAWIYFVSFVVVRHLRCHKHVHCHHHQQPGRSQGRPSEEVAAARLQGRTPERAPLHEGCPQPARGAPQQRER